MAAAANGGDGNGPDGPRRRRHATCEANYAMLLAYARKLLRGREIDAPDFVNETMSRFLEAFPEEPPPEPGAGFWMIRTLKNCLLSDWRKRAVRERSLADPANVFIGSAEPAPPRGPLDRVTLQHVAARMKDLSPKQREAYQLHLQGLRRPAIAARLGISEGTTGKRLFDARKRLLVLLTQDGAVAGGGGDDDDGDGEEMP